MGPVKILLAHGSSVGSHNQSLLTVWALDKTRIHHHRTLILNNLLIIAKKVVLQNLNGNNLNPLKQAKKK